LVNAVEEKKLIEKTQIQVTPTILLFYADTMKQKYNGAYNA
jgi:protein disulfide-isomerase A1